MHTSIFHYAVQSLRWVLYLLGFFACLAAFALWGYQWYLWHRDGTWLPLPVSKYLTLADTGWVRIDETMAILLTLNVGYPVCVAGILLMAISLVRT